MSKILITGIGSGLGATLNEALSKDGHIIYAYDKRVGHDVLRPEVDHFEELDVLINCAGVNRIEWLENVSELDWDEVMDVNVKGIFKMSQACLPALIKSKGTILNIVSNASHVPMRCSLAYCASKAAAAMMTKQLARELTPKYGITVFAVSPNKLSNTGMSRAIDEQVVKTRGWSKEKAIEYQLAGLLTGKETPPERVAEFIAFLLKNKQNHECLSGCDIPYGA